jgi:formate dehydrogenase accessory protein FdhE
MTSLQTGELQFAARSRRAQNLSPAQPFAREFLDFYRDVAGFQRNLYAQLRKDEPRDATSNLGIDLRSALDLTVVLPHFRGFLSFVQEKGPAPLAGAARQIWELSTDSWIESLQAYWEHAGRYDQQIGPFAQFFPRAFLQPYAELLAARVVLPPQVVTTSVCPLCAARPLLGVLRLEGDGGKRLLLCSFCSAEWEFRRILCPTCGEETEGKLPVYVAEQMPHVRVEACETCKFYLRTVDLTKDGNAVPLVDDIAALPLSFWADEHGYSRLQPNLLGT